MHKNYWKSSFSNIAPMPKFEVISKKQVVAYAYFKAYISLGI
jgi:hypothetical protein